MRHVEAAPPPQRTPAPAVSAPDETPQATVVVAREPLPQAAWNWLDVVAGLRLGGMAKMLADHCELVAQTGDAVTLRVAETHRHLLDGAYKDKLIAALCERHGVDLRISFEVGATADQTPQQVRTRIKAARQAEAVAAIESDPFVRELVDRFGGQIDTSTIQPTGEHP
jgi:DNA polymerase-3 subunit gamma/tau